MLKTLEWIHDNCLFSLAANAQQEYRYAEALAEPPVMPKPSTPAPIQQPNSNVVVTLPKNDQPPAKMPDPKPGEIWMARPASAWKAAKEGKTAGWASFIGDNDYARPCYIKDVSTDKVLCMPISTSFSAPKKVDIQLLPSDPDFARTGLRKPSILRVLSATVLSKEDLTHRIGTLPESKRKTIR